MPAADGLIYLSGAWRPELAGLDRSLGVMLTRHSAYSTAPLEAGLWWGNDTGCFADPAAFDLNRELAWLEGRRKHRGRCLFVTAPDRFNDGPGTLDAALPIIPILAAAGWPVAFVAQPGTEDHIPWDAIACLFIGGPDWWHRSEVVRQLVQEANSRGLWTHRGRVNSYSRIIATWQMGFKSADGTLLKYGFDTHIGNVLRALDTARYQLPLL